jgi:hypothetical protein
MSESDLNGYWSEPEGPADTTESEFGRFWSQPKPPRQPDPARPVKLLARLAGVSAVVFAVVAVFLLLPARGHDSADVIITPTRTATAPSRAASPKPTAHPRARQPHERPAKHRTRRKHARVVTRVVVEQVPPTVTAQPSPKPSARPASKPTKKPVKVPAKKTAKVEVSGEVTCLSGNSVEGVWVQAGAHSGFAPWQGGSTSKWWWWLPQGESYSLHVGCGGTQASWAVAVYTPVVSGTPNSFDCIDIASDAGYGTCYVA